MSDSKKTKTVYLVRHGESRDNIAMRLRKIMRGAYGFIMIMLI